MYQAFIKRLLDVVISLSALIFLLPVFLAVSILIVCIYFENPFFFQMRPGKGGLLFKIIKFKTMNQKRDERGNLLGGNERITVIGSWLRKTSIDELPQLINVLKGDMSLIGPRPLLVEYLKLYDQRQMRRHEVRPGVTGWAQVNGRNSITWREKFEYDIWYVDHINFLLDLKILFLTIVKVIGIKNVNSSDVITMEKFTGNK